MDAISVGIDVSKGESMVMAMRPLGEVVFKPRKVLHTAGELENLANFLKGLDGEVRAVMEATGRYHEPVAEMLHKGGLFVSVVNPKLVKDYGHNSP
jgi:transposase